MRLSLQNLKLAVEEIEFGLSAVVHRRAGTEQLLAVGGTRGTGEGASLYFVV